LPCNYPLRSGQGHQYNGPLTLSLKFSLNTGISVHVMYYSPSMNWKFDTVILLLFHLRLSYRSSSCPGLADLRFSFSLPFQPAEPPFLTLGGSQPAASDEEATGLRRLSNLCPARNAEASGLDAKRRCIKLQKPPRLHSPFSFCRQQASRKSVTGDSSA